VSESIVYKRQKGKTESTQPVTISLPVHLRAFAREKRISLSATLRNILEKEYEKENGRVPATNCYPTTSQESHSKMNTEDVSDLENQNPIGECGYE
jgi:hypothetical protein